MRKPLRVVCGNVLAFGEFIEAPVVGARLLDELPKQVDPVASPVLEQVEAGDGFAAHPGEAHLSRTIRL